MSAFPPMDPKQARKVATSDPRFLSCPCCEAKFFLIWPEMLGLELSRLIEDDLLRAVSVENLEEGLRTGEIGYTEDPAA